MFIVLDPGHGGRDSGAVGNGLQEKSVVWDLANRIKAKLRGYDAEVVIVQPSTTHVSTAKEEIYTPPAEANRLKADYYLSLHLNAGGGHGFESYVLTPGSKADSIRGVMHSHLTQYLKGYGVIDRGKKCENLAVLRLTNMPACLLEFVFIDNAAEAALLKQEVFLNGLANETAYALAVALKLKHWG